MKDTDKTNQQNIQEIQKTVSFGDKPEPFRQGELGYVAAKVFAGLSADELRSELRFPNSIITYKQMTSHSAVNASLRLYEYIASQFSFRFVPPDNPTKTEEKYARLLNEFLNDMEEDFEQVIKEAMTCNIYGFSVLEKVYKKRSDGLIAWKKFPLRYQESIAGFKFSDDGNEVTGVKQYIPVSPNGAKLPRSANGTNAIVLPLSKILLFKSGTSADPYGKSPLRDAYLAWRYLSVLEEMEAAGVGRDLAGLPLLRLPANMMAADASPAEKAAYDYWCNVMRNIHQGTQTGLVLPSLVDPETRQPLFDFELVANESKKLFDTDKIKSYYKNLILTSLFADILVLGQGSGGSFALASEKSSLVLRAVESMIKNICSVINRSLVQQTYELNNWKQTPGRYCKLDYNIKSDVKLDEYSAAIQRMAAVGLVPKTVEVVNKNLGVLGIDKLPDDTPEEELRAMLTPETSRSGDGMQEGMPSGTGSASGSSGDASIANTSNAP